MRVNVTAQPLLPFASYLTAGLETTACTPSAFSARARAISARPCRGRVPGRSVAPAPRFQSSLNLLSIFAASARPIGRGKPAGGRPASSAPAAGGAGRGVRNLLITISSEIPRRHTKLCCFRRDLAVKSEASGAQDPRTSRIVPAGTRLTPREPAWLPVWKAAERLCHHSGQPLPQGETRLPSDGSTPCGVAIRKACLFTKPALRAWHRRFQRSSAAGFGRRPLSGKPSGG